MQGSLFGEAARCAPRPDNIRVDAEFDAIKRTRRQLTPAQTAEWENTIMVKSGLADAIERGDFGAGDEKGS